MRLLKFNTLHTLMGKNTCPDNEGNRSIQESFSTSIWMATEFLVPVFVKPKLENVIREEEKCRNPGLLKSKNL